MGKRSDMMSHWLLKGHVQRKSDEIPGKPQVVRCSCGKVWTL